MQRGGSAEKDNPFAAILCTAKQLDERFAKVGSFCPQRENFRLTAEVKEKFTEKSRSEPRNFFGRKLREVVRKDGLKLVFDDGSWMCYRLSGTEPVVRVIRKRRMRRNSLN